MSDDTVAVTEEGAEENVQPVTNPAAIQLLDDVKEGVKTKQIGGSIRNRVVSTLVEEEVSRRADLLARALAKRKAQATELEKIKPDNVGFGADGSQTFESYTRPKLKEKQAAEKALVKIDKAINAAVNNADYEGVNKFADG